MLVYFHSTFVARASAASRLSGRSVPLSASLLVFDTFYPTLVPPSARLRRAPNCNKLCKHTNGLTYHITHGSCNFALPKDLEQLQALLTQTRGQDSDEPINDAKMREVEREAERRLRPYACGVGECQMMLTQPRGATTSTRATTARSDSRCSQLISLSRKHAGSQTFVFPQAAAANTNHAALTAPVVAWRRAVIDEHDDVFMNGTYRHNVQCRKQRGLRRKHGASAFQLLHFVRVGARRPLGDISPRACPNSCPMVSLRGGQDRHRHATGHPMLTIRRRLFLPAVDVNVRAHVVGSATLPRLHFARTSHCKQATLALASQYTTTQHLSSTRLRMQRKEEVHGLCTL
ncbi:hypothetical protein WOLCODRAFT_155585 [Wolfiporia cocos MD-104 SS10]|uniref:Uncharacterized protein n=1 Tax=Wolfiporia cocos (strain MD-104) TaxID=742152 RepID=A0A2H3JB85_WOLCO|nr:hypothetical protein WOLCODRAFT_155585 [Wolfiporia cocos MD-104 SS10]